MKSRALVYAPQGRDGPVAASLLTEAGIDCLVCSTLVEFQTALGDQTSFALVTEEALRAANLPVLQKLIRDQPPWSDIPFVILTQRGGGLERNPGAERFSELLRNVTFLERPFHPTTFTSVVKTAAKSRDRQFEARARIEEIHESEERLNIALVAGRLGSWELDLATMALMASDTCKAIFGRKPADDFGYDDLLQSIHADDLNRMRDAVQRTVSSGVDYTIEYRNIWPDGSVHWVDVRARNVKTRNGSQKLVGVTSDITARKTAEELLQRSNQGLEQRVLERTRELSDAHAKVLAEIEHRERAEEQLRQSQKLEMIGQLTGGVAHDFNNLLMAVLGNLELLRKNVPQEPKLLRLIDGAQQGAERGSTLTKRLLAFARRQELSAVPVDMTELVQGMADLIDRSAGGRVVVDLNVAPDLPRALLDQNQVELALLNLVVNARDAMPDGGTLTIATSAVAVRDDARVADGVYVRLAVTDTGTGMDAATLEKATEPFFSTKELGKGTGLGLSMVHGLARQLNGAFLLTSKIGQGTTAELLLPSTDAKVELPSAPEQAEAPSTAKLRVLLVDDDFLIAMSAVDMLEDLGHEVIEANSGADGLEKMQNEAKIDLIITDYSMPKMTGVQFALKVRESRPEMPILLASGYVDMPAGSGIELPRIAKPYTQNELSAAIARTLQTDN